jgi:hypothetical protein
LSQRKDTEREFEIEKLLIYDEDMIRRALDKGMGLVLMSARFGN